ncbi:MAG TPA: sugar ABC transporter permease [Thermoanaerobaculia bacterium]|nr:sugar ABC transporter permease [Thermoanaerobaculia bacterium]
MAAERTGTPAEVRAALIFLAPGLLVIGLFFLLPIGASLLLSLTDFDIYALGDVGNARVVGLRNFARLLADPLFWTSMRNTFYFVFVGGPLTLAVALGAALLLHSRLVRAKGLFRTIFFTPYITTLVAVAIVFRYLYHPRFGGLNRVLGFLGIPSIDWLGDPKWAMPAIILLAIWKNFGYAMVLFIAGLQAIPESLYEAARIDGAGPIQLFRKITVPMLAPTFLFLGILTTIGYFQFFAEPYVMTGGGGPLNATLSTGLLMYKQGFRWWTMGYAAAIAVILGIVILGFSAIQFSIEKRRNA